MVIKRYSNRKMYHNGSPMTLESIIKVLAGGEVVKILRHENNFDVTTDVLGQALLTTLDDIDCDAFDTVVTAIRVKKGWKSNV